jgi:DNA-binding NtrC family response regulator
VDAVGPDSNLAASEYRQWRARHWATSSGTKVAEAPVRRIKLLAEYFPEDFCARNNFKAEEARRIGVSDARSYGWPGNARALRNAIERMAILTAGERLTRDAIPVEIRVQRETGPKSTIQEARESAEREHILRALEESSWNVSGARQGRWG